MYHGEAFGPGRGHAGLRGRACAPAEFRLAQHLRDEPSRYQRRVRSYRGMG